MKIGYITRLLSKQGAPRTAVLTCIQFNRLGLDSIPIFVRMSDGLDTYSDLLKETEYLALYKRNHKGPFTWLYDFISGLFMHDRKGDLRIDFDLLKSSYRLIQDSGFTYIVCQNRWAGIAGYYIYKKLQIPYSVLIQEKLHIYDHRLIEKYDESRASQYLLGFVRKLAGKLISSLESKVLENAIVIFATSKVIQKSIIEKYPSLKDKIVLNYRGLDLPFSIKKVYFGDRLDRIIIDSQWDTGRRPEKYLEIAKQLEEYKFLITGGWRDIKLKDQMLSTIHNEKITNVEIKTQFTQSDLLELFSNSKFAIRFGYSEGGIPNAFLLAVSTRTPIIVNQGIGCNEIVESMGGGEIVDSIEEVVNAVRVMDNEKIYDQKQFELEKILQTYSWERHAKALLSPISNKKGEINRKIV